MEIICFIVYIGFGILEASEGIKSEGMAYATAFGILAYSCGWQEFGDPTIPWEAVKGVLKTILPFAMGVWAKERGPLM